MKLSILIPTLEERKEQFEKLWNKLADQIQILTEGEDPLFPCSDRDMHGFDGVTILHELDNREMSIGAKRNKLLDRALSEYVVFVDDDDEVPDFYVSEILKALDHKPDCVGFYAEISGTNGVTRGVHYSKDHAEWAYENQVYIRNIHHLNPIKRSILADYRFPEINWAEDLDMAEWLKDKLKTEVFIDKVMYKYNCRMWIR